MLPLSLSFQDTALILILARVSLMKNGEEVISVGGAIDPSNRNVGTSGSNSVILDLAKVIFHYIYHAHTFIM